jgi:LPS O-antigen subunit length determinant protein (WzzB/FepE family)
VSSEALERAQKSLVRLHGTAFSEDGKSCPACAVEDVLRELDAALAVAREREQRAVEALERIAKMQDPPIFLGIWEAIGVARAALVDEPGVPASAAADEPGETL